MTSTPSPVPPPEPGGDPSMDDILASIRRILSDDEKPKAEPAPDNVLVLDSSMMLPEPAPALQQPAPSHPAPAQPVPIDPPISPTFPEPALAQDIAPTLPSSALPVPVQEAVVAQPVREPAALAPPSPPPPGESLVAPEAAAAAASSVGALMRTLATERSTAVHRGGPTIEDLVREEIRPLLKQWLDTHLPPVVERLVRAEIERVMSRMAP